MTSIEHWSPADHYGRQVGTGRSHQTRRRCLIAPHQQHKAVHGIRPQLLHIHRRQIPIHHGGRPQAAFPRREHGRLQRKPAGLADTVRHALRQLAQMPVAGVVPRPGVHDGDDGAAVELVRGVALVHHPGAVENVVFRVDGGVEPAVGAEGAACVFDVADAGADVGGGVGAGAAGGAGAAAASSAAAGGGRGGGSVFVTVAHVFFQVYVQVRVSICEGNLLRDGYFPY